MNKKQERIAIIALAAFLIGVFCYQVAYGAPASPMVLSNVFTGQLANNQTSIYLCLKDGSDNASGPSNVLPSPQLSKHCGGVVSDISGPWIVVRSHPFNPAIYANSTNFNQNVTKES